MPDKKPTKNHRSGMAVRIASMDWAELANCRSVQMRFYSVWVSIRPAASFVGQSLDLEGFFSVAKTFHGG